MRSGAKIGVAVVVVLVGLLVLGALGALPDLGNPFGTEREQRDSPAILQALEDVSEYTGATANLSTSFEIEDESWLPDFLLGETINFEAYGSVDGVVDFTSLTEDAIVVEGESVTITLPEAQLANPRVDPDESQVVDVDRGVLDRFSDLFTEDAVNEAELYGIAEERLVDAAAETDVLVRAEENTEAFLVALLTELGYDDVTVRFETPADQRS